MQSRGLGDVYKRQFEPAPSGEAESGQAMTPAAAPAGTAENYRVKVNGQTFDVEVAPGGAVSSISPVTAADGEDEGDVVPAPLAGNIFKLKVKAGQKVQQGDVLVILEAMKMETEVRAPHGGTVMKIIVQEGDSVALKDPLLTIS